MSIAIISSITNNETQYVTSASKIAQIQATRSAEKAVVSYAASTGVVTVNDTGANTLVVDDTILVSSSSTSTQAESLSIRPNSDGTFTVAGGLTNVGVVTTYGNIFWSAGGSCPYDEYVTSTSSGACSKVATDPTGLFTATSASFLHAVMYTSSGTFTIPSGVSTIMVLVMGGGGGGGAGNVQSYSSQWGGGGGGGGALVADLLSGVSGSYTVTVGLGGAGGTSGDNGAPGGTSSFGSLIFAAPGGGGEGVTESGVNDGGSGITVSSSISGAGSQPAVGIGGGGAGGDGARLGDCCYTGGTASQGGSPATGYGGITYNVSGAGDVGTSNSGGSGSSSFFGYGGLPGVGNGGNGGSCLSAWGAGGGGGAAGTSIAGNGGSGCSGIVIVYYS